MVHTGGWGGAEEAERLGLAKVGLTLATVAREAAMTHNIWFDRRYLDLVVFGDQLERPVR